MRLFILPRIVLLGFIMTLAGLIAACTIYNSDWFQKKYLYPFPYQKTITYYAKENRLDPCLVASIILAESKFNPAAVSPKGALGLMQLMPETAGWIAGQINDRNFKPEKLTDPETSIRLGTWYLASLLREFNGNPVLALAAYNGGRGNVKQWMREYKWPLNFSDIKQIPFPETRDYVNKVLAGRQHYRELYGQ